MRYTDIDERVVTIAARQHGAFSRQQAFTAGASERFVQRRVAGGHWKRAGPGVFVLAASDGTWLRQCKLAELSVDGSAIGGFAAAALHKLIGFRPGPIELIVPVGANCRHVLAEMHRYAGALTCRVEHIAVTTIAQTLFDLAGRATTVRVERALDDALVGRRVSLETLGERLEFYAGSRRPGLRAMRSLLAERADEGWAPAESELETLLHQVLARVPSRPRVIRQAALPWRTPVAGRVDVLLPDSRLIIEADSRRWHTRVADFERDRWRDNQAVANGYRVQRFTWVHLHDLADETVALIEQTVRLAA